MRCASRYAFATTALFVLSALGTADERPSSPVALPQAEQFDLRARSGLEYRIFVAAPPGKAPEAGWPVIYLSDGNGNFPVLLAAAGRQAPGGAASAVVVGIGYPGNERKTHGERRTYDLTGPASEEWLKSLPKGGPALGKTGGNDVFLKFIEEELKPVIEKKHPIDRSRQALFGHSFGGLFVLHVLFTKPDAFQTYLASSPSIWWNDRSILAEEKAFVEKHAGKDVKARLLLTAGQWEQSPGPGVAAERAALLKDRRQVDNAKELANRLQKSPVKGLTVEFREFAEEDHGSVLLPAASRGMRFALDERR